MRVKAWNAASLSFSLNLDDEGECVAFLKEHSIHPGVTGRRLARALGWSGKGSGLAAKALWNYASNRNVAFRLRREGNINTAMQYEGICDRIYTQSIAGKIQCW